MLEIELDVFTFLQPHIHVMRFLRYILRFFSTKKNNGSLFDSALKDATKDFSKEMEFLTKGK